MFGGKFSRVRFSLGADSAILQTTIYLIEDFRSMVGTGANLISSGSTLYEYVLGSLKTGIGIPSVVSVYEEVQAEAKNIPAILGTIHIAEDMRCLVFLIENIYSEIQEKEQVNGIFLIAQNLYLSSRLSEKINKKLDIVQDVLNTLQLTEIVNGMIYSTILERLLMEIHVTIPPGGELRINTETFTVTLNGENVLHLHSGDWPTLSRKLVTLLIDSGTAGTLEGEMIFSNRWL